MGGDSTGAQLERAVTTRFFLFAYEAIDSDEQACLKMPAILQTGTFLDRTIASVCRCCLRCMEGRQPWCLWRRPP